MMKLPQLTIDLGVIFTCDAYVIDVLKGTTTNDIMYVIIFYQILVKNNTKTR